MFKNRKYKKIKNSVFIKLSKIKLEGIKNFIFN
jgi:hypothetical protein